VNNGEAQARTTKAGVPELYVVIDRGVYDNDEAWLRAIETLADAHEDGLALQIRLKETTPEHAMALATEARVITWPSDIPVFFNGATEEAVAFDYNGVQWPEVLIPSREEETTILRGASVHSPDAARRARQGGADFVVAGTIFDAGSKDATGQGIDHLRGIVISTPLPVLAIGGISPERVLACIEAGAAGVAVVTGVLSAPDPVAAVHEYRRALDEAGGVSR
jgi:thiamine-phosphate diphosphorylase